MPKRKIQKAKGKMTFGFFLLLETEYEGDQDCSKVKDTSKYGN